MKKNHSTVLIAMILVLSAAGCGSGGKHEDVSGKAGGEDPGRKIFVSQNCGLCHGADARGGDAAPALRNLRAEYTAGKLIEYLRDPAEYILRDPRLSARQEMYPASMPRYGHLGDDQLNALALYLLALE